MREPKEPLNRGAQIKRGKRNPTMRSPNKTGKNKFDQQNRRKTQLRDLFQETIYLQHQNQNRA